MKNKQRATTRAIKVISAEVLRNVSKLGKRVIVLDPNGLAYEILRKLPPERRQLVVHIVKTIVEASWAFGDDYAISLMTSPKERRSWKVTKRNCETCNGLMCKIKP